MAEDVVARLDDQAELRDLLRDLSQELALADMLRYKKEKLLADAPRRKDEKTKSLVEEYRIAIEEINEGASSNMSEEVARMNDFSRSVDAFNAACADYLVGLAMLKAQLKGGE
ncbi:MAG: hypothetical protein K6E59_01375 [Bacilli bacterium]|nr:hypothetical protein [Bacilli bacterium]